MPPSRRRCDACRRTLPEVPAPGRRARFCGAACRSAAYRRRQAGLRETADRWPHPRGHLSLATLPAWVAAERAAERARRARQRQAARRRSWRRWCIARWRADRLGLLWRGANPAPSDAAVAVLEEMTAAAAACAAVGARNPSGGRPDWEQEVIAAKELLAKVTPPHRSRPERRRGEREERKAAARLSRTSVDQR
jgi:hypothetical protein